MTGRSKMRAYASWAQMRERCRNPRNVRYPRYGGRGITHCERWTSFENFVADMGERPEGMSLDRIDNDGNYEPGNCRWATQEEQQRNRSTTKLTEADVASIRAKLAANEAPMAIALEYAVSRNTIYAIKLGLKWKTPAPLNLAQSGRKASASGEGVYGITRSG